MSSEYCDNNTMLSCHNCEIECAPYCTFCEDLDNCL